MKYFRRRSVYPAATVLIEVYPSAGNIKRIALYYRHEDRVVSSIETVGRTWAISNISRLEELSKEQFIIELGYL